MIIDAQLHFGYLKLSEIVIYFLSVISRDAVSNQNQNRPSTGPAPLSRFVRVFVAIIPNVSISRCAQVMLHFRKKANLLRSSINIRSN